MSGRRRRLRSWPQITFRFHDVYPVQRRPATAALVVKTGASDVTRDISKASLLFRWARGPGAAAPRHFLQCCRTISISFRSAVARRARELSPLAVGSSPVLDGSAFPGDGSRAMGRSSRVAPADSIQIARGGAAIVLPLIFLRDSKRSPHRRAARVLTLCFLRDADGNSEGWDFRLAMSVPSAVTLFPSASALAAFPSSVGASSRATARSASASPAT